VYQWFLFAHLIGVALLLAGLGAHTVSVERLRHATRHAEVAVLVSTAEFGGRLVLIGGPLLVAAGLTMAIGYWSLTDGWIASAIVLVVAQGILGSTVDRRLRSLGRTMEARAAEQGTAEPAGPVRDSVLYACSRASILLIIEILWLMSVKPARWGILWSLLVMTAMAGVATWRAVRRFPTATRVPGPDALDA
jgi:uncharacterized membrane protein